MPFLKERKGSATRRRLGACERNGWRHAVYTCDSPSRMYKGEWKSDKKDGRGSELDVGRGLLYEGEWSQNRKSGYGELFRLPPNDDRRKIYAGYWSNGKKHGFGRYWREDGAYYEGDFRCDRKHGFGRFWRADGTFYQGNWRNGLYHGEGLFVFANGNRYEGPFFKGMRQGRGTFWHICTGQLQNGRWYEDTCVRSTMEDIERRQSACAPTSYPIPELGFSGLNGSQSESTVRSSTIAESRASGSVAGLPRATVDRTIVDGRL